MLIVFNPTAGGRRRRRLARALDALAARGVRAEVVETERPGHAEHIARAAAQRSTPVVVAAGGDGTIAEVASGIAESPATALGLLPLGTANVLAWELGVPAAPEAAAAVLAAGHTALLRPGIARFADGRTRLFVQMLGAGFDAAVVASLDLGLKRRIGRGAYVWQAARELPRYRFPAVTASLDGGAPVPVASAIVSKGRLYAGRYLLAPGARPGEPGFHVALFHRSGPVDAALCGLALLLGRLPRLPSVEIRRARRIDLAGEGAPAQADGDPAGRLPLAVTDAPGPIRVVLPRGPGSAR